MIEVEFSLALNNRTGKFFALDDMIRNNGSVIRAVRYWRLRSRATPAGLWARVLGRLMTWEVEARTRSSIFDRLAPRMRPAVATLFTDPLQVLLYELTEQDIVVVHDLGPLSSPQYYAPSVGPMYERVFARIAEARCRLVFVSDASRDDYEARVGVEPASATVIYNPVRLAVVEGDEKAPVGVGGRFLLAVGAVGARKNQAGLCRAFRLSGLAEQGVQLVICGGPEPGYEEARREAQRTPGAVTPGYVSGAELRWLYAHACGFVLPSRLEGFGMPAAEALTRGLPPLLSRDPALVEVAGEAAVYVDAEDDDSIARGLRRLVEMTPAERDELLRIGRAGLARFSEAAVRETWRRFFAQIAAV